MHKHTHAHTIHTQILKMIGARLVTRQSINWTRRSALYSKFHYSTTKQVTSQVLPAAATFLPAIDTASSKESSDRGRSLLALGLFLLASPLLLSPQRSTQPTECCGIVGVVAKPQKRSTGFTARDFLIEGLTVLKNRGYDSAGVATVGDINGKVSEEVRSITSCHITSSRTLFTFSSVHL